MFVAIFAYVKPFLYMTTLLFHFLITLIVVYFLSMLFLMSIDP
jgi:hypothetical protein